MLCNVESEFLIAKWEARAEQLEECAEQQRHTFMALVAQTLEKARAFLHHPQAN